MSWFPFVWVRRQGRKHAPRLTHRIVRPLIVALALMVALTMVVVAAAGCAKAPATADSTKAGSGTGAGTGTGNGSGGGTGSGTGTTTGTYSIAVTSQGKTLKTLTLADIQKLPTVQVVADNKTQEGPKLSEVLKTAGVEKYTEVTVTGAWKEVYTLKAEQVDDTVVLDLSNRGTCKLAGAKIPKDNWVRDVTTIEVK